MTRRWSASRRWHCIPRNVTAFLATLVVVRQVVTEHQDATHTRVGQLLRHEWRLGGLGGGLCTWWRDQIANASRSSTQVLLGQRRSERLDALHQCQQLGARLVL